MCNFFVARCISEELIAVQTRGYYNSHMLCFTSLTMYRGIFLMPVFFLSLFSLAGPPVSTISSCPGSIMKFKGQLQQLYTLHCVYRSWGVLLHMHKKLHVIWKISSIYVPLWTWVALWVMLAACFEKLSTSSIALSPRCWTHCGKFKNKREEPETSPLLFHAMLPPFKSLAPTLPTMQLRQWGTSLEVIHQITCRFHWSHKRLYTAFVRICSGTTQDL